MSEKWLVLPPAHSIDVRMSPARLLQSGLLGPYAAPGMPGGNLVSKTIRREDGKRIFVTLLPKGDYLVRCDASLLEPLDFLSRARADAPFQSWLQSIAS